MLMILEKLNRLLMVVMAVWLMFELDGEYLSSLYPSMAIFIQLELVFLAGNSIRKKMLKKPTILSKHLIPMLLQILLVSSVVLWVDEPLQYVAAITFTTLPWAYHTHKSYTPVGLK